MATVTVDKCAKCGVLFENKDEYYKHLKMHAEMDAFEKEFPKVEDSELAFANGGFSVQRSKEWFDKLQAWILNIVEPLKINFPPWSYGWFRTLGDSGYWQYKITYRWQCICRKCYREWGQPYHANHCSHKD